MDDSFEFAVRALFGAPATATVTATLESEKRRRVGATTWTIDPGYVLLKVTWPTGGRVEERQFTSLPELWKALN